MKQKHLQTLHQIGLNDKEAQIYLAALHLGRATPAALSKATNINRTTIYSVSEKLLEKGLLYIETKGFKRYFIPQDPEKLKTLLDQRQRIFEKTLPELSSIYHQVAESDALIRHYQGSEGVKAIYDSILDELKPGDWYYVISDQEKWIGIDPEYFQNFKKKRSLLNLDVKLLLQESKSARENIKIKRAKNEEVKILPAGVVLRTNMVITPNKIVIIQTSGSIMGILIKNQSVVDMNKLLFESVWYSEK